MKQHERELLSKILLDNNLFFSLKIKSSVFKDRDCRLIFDAIQQLLSQSINADILELTKLLQGKVDAHTISTLTNESYTKFGWEKLEKEIYKDHKKSLIKKLNYDLSSKLEDDPDEVINFLFDQIEQITKQDDRDEILSMKEIVSNQMSIFEQRYKNRGELPGIATGIEPIDKRFLGFQPERLYYFCARPSQGKSALMMNMAVNISTSGTPTGVITVESSSTEIADRAISYVGKIDSNVLTSGFYNARTFADIQNSAEKLYTSNLYIYDKPNIKISDLKQTARRMKMIYGVKVIFIDYLQLIKVPGKQTRQEIVSEASIELKEIARELKIPIVALAQLGRDSDDKRPHLGDIQWSSQAEQDADGVVLMQAGDMILDISGESTGVQKFHFFVEKNRDGAKGYSAMTFTGSQMKFEMARDQPTEKDINNMFSPKKKGFKA
jgi:replicative DNA helicase